MADFAQSFLCTWSKKKKRKYDGQSYMFVFFVLKIVTDFD
jgi:hypothetical protein